ncbi:hypothetical protein FHS83_001137 [Rhizomicrobium palustre]|uniref:3-deoxy-D-manno-oct-2-ulosonic acid (Kdo) hydroxylase n=1 Tax=Rhizomicrobium palustre TaxID=189966 RepID=A0A846MX51_9PROT|nr:Kdo hydroxylase family protein [Rhizomicrobium palustre]NIK87819.1 hypothetical protein [Rhizomicrobium palustre]
MNRLSILDAPRGNGAALEAGKVVMLPRGGFTLLPTEEALRDPALLGGAKNISLSPDGKVKHTAASGDARDRLAALMARYADFATALVETIAPAYRGKLVRGRTSFRPAEIEGRKSTALADDTRLHVDAFPTMPMRGRRILRVFANVNPSAARVWNLGEDFAAVAERFISQITVKPDAWHALLAGLRITKARRSAYDDVMLGLHDRAKLDEAYQATCDKERVEFQPGSVWLCYTDQVMHAALKGQHALEQTFYLNPEDMEDPSTTPLAMLEKMMGRRLI